MRTAFLFAFVLLATGNPAIAADPRAGWKGAEVFPKTNAVVKVGSEVRDGEKFNLPWKVQDVKGKWLWVGDEFKGWVKRTDVVSLSEAPAYYTQVIDSGKNKGWAYYRRAIARDHAGDLESAIADCDEALRNGYRIEATLANRGNIWMKKKEYLKAALDFNRAVAINEKNPVALNNLGLARSELKYHDRTNDNEYHGDKAVGYLIETNSFVPSGRYNRMAYERSIGNLTKAIQLKPEYAEAFNNRGRSRLYARDYNRAIDDFDEAIRLDPNYVMAYSNRGLALYYKNYYSESSFGFKKDYDKAIVELDHAIRLDPTCACAYNNRGLAWHGKKNYDQAIADFTRSIQLDPDGEAAYVNRGNCWEQKNDFERAAADYDKAIELDRDNTFALNYAAWLYATCPEERFRNGNKAVELAKRACELTGSAVPDYVGTLAAAHAETGDWDSAINLQIKLSKITSIHGPVVMQRLALYQDHKPYRRK